MQEKEPGLAAAGGNQCLVHRTHPGWPSWLPGVGDTQGDQEPVRSGEGYDWSGCQVAKCKSSCDEDPEQ